MVQNPEQREFWKNVLFVVLIKIPAVVMSAISIAHFSDDEPSLVSVTMIVMCVLFYVHQLTLMLSLLFRALIPAAISLCFHLLAFIPCVVIVVFRVEKVDNDTEYVLRKWTAGMIGLSFFAELAAAGVVNE